MDQALLEAAKRGDTDLLRSMLREDPKVLQKATRLPLPDTPLHAATVAEQTDFVSAILEHDPGLSWSRNRDGLTALHIAAALGYDDIASLLLECDPKTLCLIEDNERRTPLHYAAINGNTALVERLASECPEALAVVTARKETCLHLALMNNRLDAFKVLLDRTDYGRALYAEDEHGDTVHRLAEKTGKMQALDWLKGKIRQMPFMQRLYLLGIRGEEFDPQAAQVVAALVATVTFQALVNPPQAIWKQGMEMGYKCLYEHPFSRCPATPYLLFAILNTAGFISSSSLLLFSNEGRTRVPLIRLSVGFLVWSYVLLLFAIGLKAKVAGIVLGVSYVLCLYTAKLAAKRRSSLYREEQRPATSEEQRKRPRARRINA